MRRAFCFTPSFSQLLRKYAKLLDNLVQTAANLPYINFESSLAKAKKKIFEDLQRHSKLWAIDWCSLMIDSWTNKNGCCVTYVSAHSEATVDFYNFIENYTSSHTREFIFNWMNKCIKVIKKKIVQVVTNNHATNTMTKDLLKEKKSLLSFGLVV